MGAPSRAAPDGQAGSYRTAPTISWRCTGSTSGVATSSAPTTVGLGNGYDQLNWQAPRGYSRSCGTVRLSAGDCVAHTFSMEFTR